MRTLFYWHYWYRILREHQHWTRVEAVRYAAWLAKTGDPARIAH